MIVRLRSRDGLERVEVADGSTVADLKVAIQEKLGIPLEDMLLSQDPKLLTTKGVAETEFFDMEDDASLLSTLGIQHGSLIHMLYHFERQVQGVTLSEFDRRPFGAHMTVEELVAKQTRIERQDAPKCSSVSFDMHAANTFQSYVQSALAFSIKRGGILYGTLTEDGGVCVNAIFEPPQEGSPDSLRLERGGEDEARADAIAAALGWQKVGWIFAQSTKEREFICSAEEICQMAAIQDEMGPHAVTALVALFPADEEGDAPEVHFEAFQVSEQCVALWKDGWFVGVDDTQGAAGTVEPSNTLTLRNPAEPKNTSPVIVAGKDAGEVDSDYFLVPVGIKDHAGPLGTAFQVENRLLPQGRAELKAHLQRAGGVAYVEKLSDFHLLLFLAKQPGFEAADVAVVAGAVARKDVIPEGYKIIIDSLAGL